MTLEDGQIHELELMARHEEVIGELYAEYARMFPEQREFWSRLEAEEKGHAGWIRKLFPQVEDGVITFNDNRFNTKAITTSMRYVSGWVTSARNSVIQPIEALARALDIENALIEKNYLAIYETDNLEMKQVFSALQEGTKQHRERISDLLKEIKKEVPPVLPFG